MSTPKYSNKGQLFALANPQNIICIAPRYKVALKCVDMTNSMSVKN